MSIPLHVFSQIELSFFLTLNYTIIWFLLYNSLSLFVKDKHFKLKLVTVIFYICVPTFLAILLIQDLWTKNTQITMLQLHVLFVIVAFYSFSTIMEFKVKPKYNWSLIIHHTVFGVVIFFATTMITNSPSYWLWVIAVQFSGIFVSLRNILVKYPNWAAAINPFLEQCDFITFLSIRIIFQTLLMFLVASEMDYCATMDYIILSAFGLSLVLNLHWFKLILRRRKRKQVAKILIQATTNQMQHQQ